MSVLRIKPLPHFEGLNLPAYETKGSAGLDLSAAIDEPIVLGKGSRCLVPTGLCIELPFQHEGQIRPRSGLAVKHGVTVLNSPGTIDEDYRGEVKIPLINHGDEDFVVSRGMRIAQLIIAPVVQVEIETVSELSSTVRGSGGFGSTGG